ncbi:hypothetical protein [Mycobacterium sp.]|jgi:uncharacterized protein|uniref:hypothetical protein n=1 Tax=Mycobacterium sp. TaxID=1785 RepID=UPI002C18CDA6|nr:hypothetical protein [Mycobacterium sp.]HXB86086.1 hypothetical protein [Mycobacterium sp.]
MTTTAPNQPIDTVDVAVVSGPTSPGTVGDWELFFARRALAMLKSRLGREGLLELLKPDLDDSAEHFRAWVAASEGKWRPAQTELRVKGISAAEFLAYFHSAIPDQPRLLAAEPEHFVMTQVDDRLQVVENLGPYITDLRILLTDDDQAIDDLTADYPVRMVGNVILPDGTLFAHALHQFRETADGFDVVLGIYFPDAAPAEVIEGHRQHLAVEFTNWIIDAGTSLGGTGTSPVPIVVTGTERYTG